MATTIANAILYLCDGNVESCRKSECYKKGGKCKHTLHRENSLTNIIPSNKNLSRFDIKKHPTIQGLTIFVEKEGPWNENHK